MSVVHPLWHVRLGDEDGDDAKLMGIYSSESAARAAIERIKYQPGFRDHPAGFHVDRYVVDQDHWIEGFGIAQD